jgi:hypothetical protein
MGNAVNQDLVGQKNQDQGMSTVAFNPTGAVFDAHPPTGMTLHNVSPRIPTCHTAVLSRTGAHEGYGSTADIAASTASAASADLRTSDTVAETDSILDHLSDNAGNFQAGHDGQIHYYGSTSDLSLQPLVRQPVLPVEGHDLGHTAGALCGYPAVQEKLLDLFWQYPHPYLRIPDRNGFMAGVRKGSRTCHFSQFLLTSILLRTIHHSDDQFIRGLASGLLERAKEQLYIEMERPDLNTILGLLYLSNYVADQQSTGLGWLYMGTSTLLLPREVPHLTRPQASLVG